MATVILVICIAIVMLLICTAISDTYGLRDAGDTYGYCDVGDSMATVILVIRIQHITLLQITIQLSVTINVTVDHLTNHISLYTYGILPTKLYLVKFRAGQNQYIPDPNNLYNLETNVVSNTEATGYHQQSLATVSQLSKTQLYKNKNRYSLNLNVI
jgi:hypothetical protein